MRTVSVSEFSRYCSENRPSCYIYATDNQRDTCQPAMKIMARFTEVIINLKPNRICFKSDACVLCFDRVKEVQMFDDRPSIGVLFSIVCVNGGKEASYTLIAD